MNVYVPQTRRGVINLDIIFVGKNFTSPKDDGGDSHQNVA